MAEAQGAVLALADLAGQFAGGFQVLQQAQCQGVEGTPRWGQLDLARAALQQRGGEVGFQFAHLPAEG